MIALIYADDAKTTGDAFIYQNIEKDEYDVYFFRINLKNGRLQLNSVKVDDKVKQSLGRHLNATARIKCEVRDAYNSTQDIKSIFEVLADDPREVMEAFYDIIGIEPQRSTDEHPYKQKYVYKRKEGSNEAVLSEETKPGNTGDVKKSGFERNKDGKLTGAGAKDAQQISEMLKAIARDDKSFAEVVRLFTAIKNLTEKAGGDYAKALAAINARLYKKQEK